MGKHHHHHHKKDEFARIRRDLDKTPENVLNVEAINRPNIYFTREVAQQVAQHLGIDFGCCGYDVEQFRIGMDVELEHGLGNPITNMTNNDPMMTGRITLAHLTEYPDYYKRLTKMEEEAEKYWERKRKHRKSL